ncbi:PpiC-type peptidyl-prolyl cis-trans isomerase precursor [Alloactinosynnema sp. L-07]|uniref:SurA N-terminal domain-containing protein n=1 Tax=Alloactinosynnema sp. L-07 TaxID=1653480 RepID=UPI00065F0A21|nr:SurA N-terminal domain-containing protein [Alloactinosynnema sp. L-07]CRK61515.1 PpiC-type peptidyl-prolyl cis-trans isomerase precursor [Alloactinosynnema sp. L-07]
MTTVIRRRRPLVALLAGLALLVSACATGQGPANAAAVVNGKTISVDRVQELVDKAVKAEPAVQTLADNRKLDLVSRAVLRQLVLHELIAAYAAKENLTAEPAQVTELAKQLAAPSPLPTDGSATDQMIVGQAVNRVMDTTELARDYLLLAEIGFKQAAGLAVTIDYSFVAADPAEGAAGNVGSLRDKAFAKARQMATSLDEAAKVIDADLAQDSQSAEKGRTFSPALAPDLAGSVLFGAPVNSVIAFQPSQEQAGWVVAVIRKRDTAATPDPKAPEVDVRLATSLGPRMLQATADEVGIELSPRYGVWDAADMAPAPSEGETKGLIVPIKNATP